MPVQPVLQRRGMVMRYGHLTAIDNSDFDLFPGEILAVIGDNGAGSAREADLQRRLVARWRNDGLDPGAARARAPNYDILNARTAAEESRAAPITLRPDAAFTH